MNLKEYAEKSGLTLSEAKEITGLTHWKQPVPDAPVAPSNQEVVREEIVPETAHVTPEQDDADVLAEGVALQGLLGQKTRDYLRFVLDNKESLPVEYKRTQQWIEKWIV